jgi:DNA-directed RNA polymerase subunit E'/Rpb7
MSAAEQSKIDEATAVVKSVAKRRKPRKVGIFAPAMMTQRVYLPMQAIGSTIKQILENKLAKEMEGKCVVEGYVKPGSVVVESYSSGMLSDEGVMFDVIMRCLVCCPVEGMHIDCVAKNITESAGIKAETEDDPSPIIIYIARDHNFNNKNFSKVNVGDKIKVRVIGQRFELNDKYISVIAELIEDKAVKYGNKKKKLVIKD